MPAQALVTCAGEVAPPMINLLAETTGQTGAAYKVSGMRACLHLRELLVIWLGQTVVLLQYRCLHQLDQKKRH